MRFVGAFQGVFHSYDQIKAVLHIRYWHSDYIKLRDDPTVWGVLVIVMTSQLLKKMVILLGHVESQDLLKPRQEVQPAWKLEPFVL